MEYIIGTLRYVFKNFIFLFAFSLLPSYFFAFSLDYSALEKMADIILSGRAQISFGLVFSCFSFFFSYGWAFTLVAFIFAVICLPMLFAFIEKHMRLGIRSYKGLLGRINYNFVSSFVLLALLLAIYELWALIASAMIFAASLLFGGIAQYVICILIAAAMMFLLIFVLYRFLLWLPCLQVMGYSFMDSLLYANQLCSEKKGKIFVSVFLPYIFCVVLVLVTVGLCSVYRVTIPVFVLIELIYLFGFLYYSVLMYVVYFERTGELREDLKKKF